jgi:hypothetical protein
MRPMPGRPRGMGRLCRSLGFDRNPLRRASDRAEAWIRVGLLAVFLTAGPPATSAAPGIRRGCRVHVGSGRASRNEPAGTSQPAGRTPGAEDRLATWSAACPAVPGPGKDRPRPLIAVAYGATANIAFPISSRTGWTGEEK